MLFFFFSSRRRHTRCSRDWSSDVCSSDLPERMDDEWHLHTFDLKSLLAAIPRGLRVARVEAIPFRWLPLRYVARCEPADRLGAAPRRRRSRLGPPSPPGGGRGPPAAERRGPGGVRPAPPPPPVHACRGAGE